MKDLARTAQQEKAQLLASAAAALPAPEAFRANHQLPEVLASLVRERKLTLDEVEKAMVEVAIEHAEGNFSRASAMLGISRGQLLYHRKRMGGNGL